jgi:mRNA-degrading endonuclease RelE of RelBE toxin-antitoxin system
VEIYYSDQALKQLGRIITGDKKAAQKIADKIQQYAENSTEDYDIKHLKGTLGDRLRLRVGRYRIIFKVENNVMKISAIKHRQEAYND